MVTDVPGPRRSCGHYRLLDGYQLPARPRYRPLPRSPIHGAIDRRPGRRGGRRSASGPMRIHGGVPDAVDDL